MVIIHLIAAIFVSAYLLILTIPLHLILTNIKKCYRSKIIKAAAPDKLLIGAE
jgi:hypothetical protein